MTNLGGRPSKFTQELADEICERISEGESLRRICLSEHMPERRTVYSWLMKPEFEGFQHQYTRARELQAENFADEMNDIADDGSNDYMENVDDQGAVIGYKLNGEHIQRSKLRIDTRKWIASKLKPKKYGDKIEVENSGSIEHKHSIGEMTDEQLANIASAGSTRATK